MSLVLDNSVALAWTLADENNNAADRVLEGVMHSGGHVPFIFRAEFSNGLTMALRSGRLDDLARGEAIAFMEALDLTHDVEGKSRMETVVKLADQHDLTVYDALYLELAQRLACPLATFDRKLVRAALNTPLALAVPKAET